MIDFLDGEYYERAQSGRIHAPVWMERAAGDEEEEDTGNKSTDTTTFIASTDRVDRYGDVVEQRWSLASFKRNPVILHEHAPPVIGTGEAKHVKDGDSTKLQIKVKWDVGEHNPIATLVATQHARGVRRAGSVGFRPGKSINRTELGIDDPHYVDPKNTSPWRAGYKYFAPELLEFSSVAVPANPDAIQLQSYLKRAENQDEAIARVVRELATKEHTAWVLDAIQRDAGVRAAVRALLLGTEPNPTPSQGDPLSHLWGT